MRLVSLTARLANEAQSSSEIEVVLVQFEHPDLGEPVRVSSDPSERISSDPLIYGTRSTWLGANPVTEPFLFMAVAAELPGDQEDVPLAARLVLSNFDASLVAVLRDLKTPPMAQLAVVLAATPDVIEVEARDLMVTVVNFEASQIELLLTRRVIEDESFPTARMTKERFPGQY